MLLIWAGVTFGVAFFGRELSHIDFFGWPLSFWVGAQGALICYVIIIAYYARVMNKMDRNLVADDHYQDSEVNPDQKSVEGPPRRPI